MGKGKVNKKRGNMLKRRAKGNRQGELAYLEMLQKDCKPIIIKKKK